MTDQQGFYKGKHFTEWVDDVKDLKRTNRLDEALSLLHHLVAATEAESRAKKYSSAPWYYEQVAIIARKKKDLAAEVAVLERYQTFNTKFGRASAGMQTRLRAARALQDAAAKAAIPAACPACGTVLDPAPTKAGPCPDCGQKILVRRREGQTVLFTEDGDQAAKAAVEVARHREKMLRRANTIGAVDADFERESSELTARFGSQADPADVFWGLANKLGIQHASTGDWVLAASVYREMAEHLVDEGRPWESSSAEAVRCLFRFLQGYTDPSAPYRVVGCACPVCVAASPTQTTFGALLVDPDLPHANCSTPPCKCWPQFIYDADNPPRVVFTVELPEPTASPLVLVPRRGFWARFTGKDT